MPSDVQAKVHSGDANFVTDSDLRSALGTSSATPEQVDEAVSVNEDAMLRALRASFLLVAGISLLAIFPAARLPKYVPDELSAADIVSEAAPTDEMSGSVGRR
jgi:hypothetical protein